MAGQECVECMAKLKNNPDFSRAISGDEGKQMDVWTELTEHCERTGACKVALSLLSGDVGDALPLES